MSLSCFRTLCLAFVSLALAGCVSSSGKDSGPKPDPTPQAALDAASDPQALQVLTGNKLTGCLLESPLERVAKPEESARFDSAATRDFATAMARAETQLRPFAGKVRAYSFVPGAAVAAGAPGTAAPDVAAAPAAVGETAVTCYYEKRGSDLRFLVAITPNADPLAREAQLRDAVLIAYAKMAGKPVASVRTGAGVAPEPVPVTQ
jgi:hypothetical protein